MKDAKEMTLLITKQMIKEGKIIRAGWVGFEDACVPHEAGPIQRAQTEAAFYGGALHLFTSIMSGMEDDEEEGEKQLNKIHIELREFEARLKMLFPELAKYEGLNKQ